MNIRENSEMLEEKILSKNACLSKNSKGRERKEEKCEIRTDFSRDRDRIIHSKSFRRLKHKTQVFISPENDHYRTRLTHTLEVSQIARTISKALMLNEVLTEAIALGHDLGHTPFGHIGESILNELSPNGFKHYQQSLRVVDIIEKKGEGLNLTYEVRDGIVNHTGSNMASTFEGVIVKYADRFAYLNHDIDDAMRAGLLKADDIPKEYTDVLGCGHSARINTLISDIVNHTSNENKVCMSKCIENAMMGLRKFLFDNIYIKLHDQDDRIERIIKDMYGYFYKNPNKLPDEYKNLLKKDDIDTVLCDYISSMSDRYILYVYNELFLPKTWSML